jgi:imidazolonepropionase
MAVRLDCHSADHLLRISEENITALAASDTIATLLPGTAFYLNLPYAPARALIAADCAVALATDCNPGTNMCESMGMTLALACMGMRMTIEEAITAATLNGAAALGISNSVGMIAPGMVADLLVCDVAGYAELVYHYGVNHVERVVKGGELF